MKNYQQEQEEGIHYLKKGKVASLLLLYSTVFFSDQER